MKKTTGAKPVDLRKQNYQTIIQLFRENQSLAARDIMEVVSLSKTAITNILNNLIQANLILPIGKGASTNQGGKKPELYALNPDYGYTIVVYFSNDLCLCQLYNMNYESLAEVHRTATDAKGFSYEDVLSLSVEAIRCILSETGIHEEQLCGIVFHCAGIVLSKEGILSRPILSPQWGKDLHVIEDFQARLSLSVPFYLDNSCRYHGYYELLGHPERRSQNIITLLCTTSVGGSQIRMGHLIHGLTGLVGEYGHITTDYSFTEQCNCGNYGCFESSTAESYVLQRIRHDLKIHNFSSLRDLPPSSLTIQDIFHAANTGDILARKHLDFIIQQFAVLIYNMQITYDPDEIIIQGSYANSEGYFQDTLSRTIRHLSLHSIQNQMKLTFNALYQPGHYTVNMNFGMKGAALFCFDQYFEQIDFTL